MRVLGRRLGIGCSHCNMMLRYLGFNGNTWGMALKGQVSLASKDAPAGWGSWFFKTSYYLATLRRNNLIRIGPRSIVELKS
jgi:hypothetical protein